MFLLKLPLAFYVVSGAWANFEHCGVIFCLFIYVFFLAFNIASETIFELRFHMFVSLLCL